MKHKNSGQTLALASKRSTCTFLAANSCIFLVSAAHAQDVPRGAQTSPAPPDVVQVGINRLTKDEYERRRADVQSKGQDDAFMGATLRPMSYSPPTRLEIPRETFPSYRWQKISPSTSMPASSPAITTLADPVVPTYDVIPASIPQRPMTQSATTNWSQRATRIPVNSYSYSFSPSAPSQTVVQGTSCATYGIGSSQVVVSTWSSSGSSTFVSSSTSVGSSWVSTSSSTSSWGSGTSGQSVPSSTQPFITTRSSASSRSMVSVQVGGQSPLIVFASRMSR